MGGGAGVPLPPGPRPPPRAAALPRAPPRPVPRGRRSGGPGEGGGEGGLVTGRSLEGAPPAPVMPPRLFSRPPPPPVGAHPFLRGKVDRPRIGSNGTRCDFSLGAGRWVPPRAALRAGSRDRLAVEEKGVLWRPVALGGDAFTLFIGQRRRRRRALIGCAARVGGGGRAGSCTRQRRERRGRSQVRLRRVPPSIPPPPLAPRVSSGGPGPALPCPALPGPRGAPRASPRRPAGPRCSSSSSSSPPPGERGLPGACL